MFADSLCSESDEEESWVPIESKPSHKLMEEVWKRIAAKNCSNPGLVRNSLAPILPDQEVIAKEENTCVPSKQQLVCLRCNLPVKRKLIHKLRFIRKIVRWSKIRLSKLDKPYERWRLHNALQARGVFLPLSTINRTWISTCVMCESPRSTTG